MKQSRLLFVLFLLCGICISCQNNKKNNNKDALLENLLGEKAEIKIEKNKILSIAYKGEKKEDCNIQIRSMGFTLPWDKEHNYDLGPYYFPVKSDRNISKGMTMEQAGFTQDSLCVDFSQYIGRPNCKCDIEKKHLDSGVEFTIKQSHNRVYPILCEKFIGIVIFVPNYKGLYYDPVVSKNGKKYTGDDFLYEMFYSK